MSIGDDAQKENRREFCRVEVCIPFACRLVPPDEQKKIRSHISGSSVYAGHETLPEVKDPAIAEWLNLLNSKLDTLIRLLTLEREGFYALPFECVNHRRRGVAVLLSGEISARRYAGNQDDAFPDASDRPLCIRDGGPACPK